MPRSVVKSQKSVRVKSPRVSQHEDAGTEDLDLMDLSEELDARDAAMQVIAGQAGATHPRFLSSDDMSF